MTTTTARLATDALARIQLPQIPRSGYVAARFISHPEPRKAADQLDDMRTQGRMSGKAIAHHFSV